LPAHRWTKQHLCGGLRSSEAKKSNRVSLDSFDR
jgi:hypothetical protein